MKLNHIDQYGHIVQAKISVIIAFALKIIFRDKYMNKIQLLTLLNLI
jgi:hypothetical protein